MERRLRYWTALALLLSSSFAMSCQANPNPADLPPNWPPGLPAYLIPDALPTVDPSTRGPTISTSSPYQLPTVDAQHPFAYRDFSRFYPQLLSLPAKPAGDKLSLPIPTTIYNFTEHRVVDNRTVEALYGFFDYFFSQNPTFNYKFQDGRSSIFTALPRNVTSRTLVIVPSDGVNAFSGASVDQPAATYYSNDSHGYQSTSLVKVVDQPNAPQTPGSSNFRLIAAEIINDIMYVSATGKNIDIARLNVVQGQELLSNSIAQAIELRPYLSYDDYSRYMSLIEYFGEHAIILTKDQYKQLPSFGETISRLEEISPMQVVFFSTDVKQS